MTRRRLSPILAAALLALAACAPADGGGATDGDGGAATVTTAESDLGTHLVGPDGRTLYLFTQDAEGVSTCTGGCAETWPPLTVDAGTEPTAGSGVSGSLGTIERDDGTTQVTIEGVPLYFYAPDQAAGDANGQGVGDVWWVVDPSGGAIREASSGGADPYGP